MKQQTKPALMDVVSKVANAANSIAPINKDSFKNIGENEPLQNNPVFEKIVNILQNIDFSKKQIEAIKIAATASVFKDNAPLPESGYLDKQNAESIAQTFTDSPGKLCATIKIFQNNEEMLVKCAAYLGKCLEDISCNIPVLLKGETPHEIDILLKTYQEAINYIHNNIENNFNPPAVSDKTLSQEFLQNDDYCKGADHLKRLPKNFASDLKTSPDENYPPPDLAS